MAPPKRPTFEELIGCNYRQIAFIVEYLKDFNVKRAADITGVSPENGHKLIQKPHVARVITNHIMRGWDDDVPDPKWFLLQLVENHQIARYQGNIHASTRALMAAMKHVDVNALAPTKVINEQSTTEAEPVSSTVEWLEKQLRDGAGEEEPPSLPVQD